MQDIKNLSLTYPRSETNGLLIQVFIIGFLRGQVAALRFAFSCLLVTLGVMAWVVSG